MRRPDRVFFAGACFHGLQVKALALEMEKSPDSITKAIARATRRRTTTPALRSELDRLDEAIVSAGRGPESSNGGRA